MGTLRWCRNISAGCATCGRRARFGRCQPWLAGFMGAGHIPPGMARRYRIAGAWCGVGSLCGAQGSDPGGEEHPRMAWLYWGQSPPRSRRDPTPPDCGQRGEGSDPFAEQRALTRVAESIHAWRGSTGACAPRSAGFTVMGSEPSAFAEGSAPGCCRRRKHSAGHGPALPDCAGSIHAWRGSTGASHQNFIAVLNITCRGALRCSVW